MTGAGSISSSTLRELISSGAGVEIKLIAESITFRILIRYGQTETTLHAKRGHIRTFKSLERAVMFIHKLGISQVSVDLTNWNTSPNA
jgi:hypothetical protein